MSTSLPDGEPQSRSTPVSPVATPQEPEGMGLRGAEAFCLAWRLLARLASDWSQHIDWEDVPELGERTWENLTAEMDEVAGAILRRSAHYDRLYEVDSADLLERAQSNG